MNKCSGSICANITESAMKFESKVEDIALSKWGYKKEDVEKAFLELQSYRDTRLTPEQISLREDDIKLAQRENKEFREKILQLREELKKFRDIELKPEDILKLIKQKEQILNDMATLATTLNKYIEAEKQGLLINLSKRYSVEEVKDTFHSLMENCYGIPVPKETTDFVVDDLMR